MASEGSAAFGTLVRRCRIDRRLTQEQLAEATGLSTRSISNYERGSVRHPRPGTVRLLADALGLSGVRLTEFEAVGRAGYWDGRRAAAAAAVPAPAELPPPTGGFVGRGAQLAVLDSWLPDGPSVAVVVVSGAAGVGKSALAAQWAQRVRHRFDGGQLHVDLHGRCRVPPVEALGRALRSLDPVPDLPAELPAATSRYRTVTADRRLLVLVDGAADAEQVRPLVPAGPGSVLVVTSRDTLAGMVVRDGARRLELGVLPAAEAYDLLARVLGDDRVRAEPDSAAELAALCGHLPLALRIAAANLLDRPGASISDSGRQLRANRLAALDPGGDEQDGVRAAFGMSYAALSGPARRLFRCLGATPVHDVTAETASVLLAADAARPLAELAAAHLVERRGADRFAPHDLLRLYAAERAAAEDDDADRTSVRRRLQQHYVRRARAAVAVVSPGTPLLPVPDEPPAAPAPSPDAALEWLDAEHRNLVATTVAAVDDDCPVLLADALRGYVQLRRRPLEWASVAAAGLAAARRRGDPAGVVAALLTTAAVHLARDDYHAALRLLEEAGPLAEEAGWTAGRVDAAGLLGNAYRLTGRLGPAARQLQDAGTPTWAGGPVQVAEVRARGLYRLGLLAHEEGRLAYAADCFGRALALHQEDRCGPAHLAGPVLGLGDVGRQRGGLDEAGRHLDRALALHREVADRAGEAYTLRCLAELHRDRGDTDTALRYAEDAGELARTVDDRRVEAQALQTWSTIRLRQGCTAEAIAGHVRALALATGIGNHYTAAEAMLGLAATYRLAGDPGRAELHAREARDIARATGYRWLEAQAARVLLPEGDSDGCVSGAARRRSSGRRAGPGTGPGTR